MHIIMLYILNDLIHFIYLFDNEIINSISTFIFIFQNTKNKMYT